MTFLLNKVILPPPEKKSQRLFDYSPDQPLEMLSACPIYKETDLVKNEILAKNAKVNRVWTKLESTRMSLGSFKATGGAYAVANIIRKAVFDKTGTLVNVREMQSDMVKRIAADMTFITASAGNHGLSVAAGAKIFGANANIVLSETVPDDFERRLQEIPANVVRAGKTYEDSVEYAIRVADENNWILLADGSWPGYIERPAMVMQGYTVIPHECANVFSKTNHWPSHIFLQAGVGGLACSFAAHVRHYWPVQPKIIIVEPDAAPCLMHSIANSTLVSVSGPVSNMGRLDCKDASLIAFESLKADADAFMLISDQQAQITTDYLQSEGIPSSPSGTAGYCALQQAMGNPELAESLQLNSDADCLVIISEGQD